MSEASLILIGVASGVAQLITFVDWAMVKRKGRKQERLLYHTFKTLEVLEVNLKQIRTIVEEEKTVTPSEIKKYADTLSEAKSQLLRDLFGMGIELPKEKPPKVKKVSEKVLVDIVNTCFSDLMKAKNTLSPRGPDVSLSERYLFWSSVEQIPIRSILAALIIIFGLTLSLLFSPHLLLLTFLPVYAFWLVHTSLLRNVVFFILVLLGAVILTPIYWYLAYRLISWIYRNLKRLSKEILW